MKCLQLKASILNQCSNATLIKQIQVNFYAIANEWLDGMRLTHAQILIRMDKVFLKGKDLRRIKRVTIPAVVIAGMVTLLILLHISKNVMKKLLTNNRKSVRQTNLRLSRNLALISARVAWLYSATVSTYMN